MFEGGDATGKSTQARLLAERRGARFTFEPGDCSIGPAVRSILLDPANDHLSFRAEALLYAADRAQHVEEVIRPTLESGVDVVADRYVSSSVVYQGIGRGFGAAAIAEISRFATGGLLPDITVLLDVDPSLSDRRLGGDRDRLEQAGDEFHRMVRQGYLDLAEGDDSWLVIDSSGSIAEVAVRIDAGVTEILP